MEDRLAGLELNSPTAGAGLTAKEVRRDENQAREKLRTILLLIRIVCFENFVFSK